MSSRICYLLHDNLQRKLQNKPSKNSFYNIKLKYTMDNNQSGEPSKTKTRHIPRVYFGFCQTISISCRRSALCGVVMATHP